MTTERIEHDVPRSLKILMMFIDRVGFPIVAFLLIFYVCYVSLQRMTEAMQKISVEMMTQRKELSDAIQKSAGDHDEIKREIRSLDIPRRR